MLIKPPALSIRSTSSAVSAPLTSLTSSLHCSLCRCLSRSLPPANYPLSKKRCYATTQHSKWSDNNAVPAWPRTPNPSPYDIFDISRSAPYTKRRFYQLVKLYHPDTQDQHSAASSSGPNLSHETRLERYRLVIAANNLLSDPSKRRLYDTHGIGWTSEHRSPTLREADRAWRYQPGNPARNATWEDWERWRDAQAGRAGTRADTLYMSNAMFATIVVMLCMVGALAQSNRAEHSGANYVDFMDGKNTNISEQMRQQHRATAGLSKDERVDTFLRDRENVAYVYMQKKYDGPQADGPGPV